MTKFKKFTALFLLLALLVSVFSIAAAAQNSLKLAVETANENKWYGEEVTLTIKMENNTGMTNYELFVDYDSDRLVLKSIDANEDLGFLTAVNLSKDYDGKDCGFITGARAEECSDANATLFTVTFAVKENAPEGMAEVNIINRKFNLVSALGLDELLGIAPVSGGVNISKDEEPVEIPYAFTSSMTAALELESEVFMVISPVLTNADGSALSAEQAAAAQDGVGIIMWDAATAPAEVDATIENAADATVVLGATYNAASGKMEVRTDGIAAKALGDNLTIRSFYTDGNGQYIYGKYVASYSPKKYCYNQITKGTSTKDVCIALLNYGAAAQVYFDYNTDTLMNSELTADQQAYNWDGSLVRSNWTVDAAKEGTLARQNPPVNSRGGTLELEGAINVVFSGAASSISVAKAELLIWDEEAFAAADVLSEENAAQVVEMSLRADGKYEYIYEGVAAKEMFKTIYACQKYTDTDGNVYYGGVLPFCAERYGYNNQNKADGLGELVQTMIIYGDTARAYFG